MSEVNRSLQKNSASIKNIQKSLGSFGQSLRKANSTSSGIIRSLYESNKDKKAATIKQRELFQKRREAVQRREQEDVIEAGKVGSVFRRTGKIISGSTKGFLGRIMDFVGAVMVGWVINNLPTIIKRSEKMIENIQSVLGVVGDWVNGIMSFFSMFMTQLAGLLGNLMAFDFNVWTQQIRKGIDKTTSGVTEFNQSLDRMITTLENFDLLAAIGWTDEPSADPNVSPEDQGGTPGAAGKLLPIHKKALDIIAGPESGGDYNAMNNGQAGDRPGGAKKWLGKNLTDMTIGEVKDFQNNKKSLWAAGRYQIIPGTLPTAQKGAGLSDSDKFDEANQDLMGIALLKIQGPEAWSRYSSYTPAQLAIMREAKATPYGQVQSTRPSSGPAGQAPAIDKSKRYGIRENISNLLGDTAIVTSKKGWRWGRMHSGIDIGCDPGVYISLTVNAEVDGYKWDSGYGHVIDLWVPSLGVQLRFAHNSTILIKSGYIPAGTSFATTGSTGRSTGPHIHFEVDSRKGRTAYGSNMVPDPYVKLIKLTRKSVQGTVQENGGGVIDRVKGALGLGGPSLEGVPSEKLLTQERTGQTIPVPMPSGQSQQAPTETADGGGGGGSSIAFGQSNQLNTFVTKALLRELEYV